MRLWVTLTFAAIAAVTAIVVTSVFAARSEQALKSSAQDFALGNTINAADQLSKTINAEDAFSKAGRNHIRSTAVSLANQRRLAVWVIDSGGNLMSSKRSRRAEFKTIPGRYKAIVAGLSGGRYVNAANKGSATVVGVRIPRLGWTVVTYSTRPELAAQLGIVHSQVVQTALFASLAGA